MYSFSKYLTLLGALFAFPADSSLSTHKQNSKVSAAMPYTLIKMYPITNEIMPNNFKYIYKFISNLEFKKKNDALNTKKKI